MQCGVRKMRSLKSHLWKMWSPASLSWKMWSVIQFFDNFFYFQSAVKTVLWFETSRARQDTLMSCNVLTQVNNGAFDNDCISSRFIRPISFCLSVGMNSLGDSTTPRGSWHEVRRCRRARSQNRRTVYSSIIAGGATHTFLNLTTFLWFSR